MDSFNNSSDEDDIMAVTSIVLFYKMLKRKKRRSGQYLGWSRRRWWVRPVILQMQSNNEYEVLFRELKEERDEIRFFKYTRMTLNQWDDLLDLIAPLLQKKHVRGFPPEKDLIITLSAVHFDVWCTLQVYTEHLQYLVTGNHFCDLAMTFGCGESTVGLIVRRTCLAIIKALKSSQLFYRSENDYYEIPNEDILERTTNA